MVSNKILSWLNTGIFPATVMFSCGFDYSEMAMHLKKCKGKEWLQAAEYQKAFIESSKWCAMESHFIDDKGVERKLFIIFIKPLFRFTDDCFIKLSHEVLHICQFLLPSILNRDKEVEAEAYLHTHLMTQILTILRKK